MFCSKPLVLSEIICHEDPGTTLECPDGTSKSYSGDNRWLFGMACFC